MTAEEVVTLLRARCEKAGAAAKWAKANKMSQSYVSDILSGRREPSALVLGALGLERVVTYQKAKGK